MTTYIKIDIPNNIATFPKQLDSKLYNNIGTSWEDYLNGKWVKLSKTQLEYYNNNPKASIQEIFNMEADSYRNYMTIENAKQNVINSLKNYDKSPEINIFYLNNEPVWLDNNERISICHRLDVEKKTGLTKTTLWIKNNKYEMSIDNALYILLSLENYAIACLDNTNNHILNINKLKTIEEINNYDFLQGYPDKLKFVI